MVTDKKIHAGFEGNWTVFCRKFKLSCDFIKNLWKKHP